MHQINLPTRGSHWLLFIILLLSFSASRAETVEFPKHGCAIELPASSKWTVQNPEPSDPTRIFAAISDDKKIIGAIVVLDIFPKTPKDREEYFAGVRHGLKRSGWTVTGERDQPFGERVGHFIGAKSIRDGTTCVQVTFYLFANERTYAISSVIVADKVPPELLERAKDFLPGFKLLPEKGNP